MISQILEQYVLLVVLSMNSAIGEQEQLVKKKVKEEVTNSAMALLKRREIVLGAFEGAIFLLTKDNDFYEESKQSEQSKQSERSTNNHQYILPKSNNNLNLPNSTSPNNHSSNSGGPSFTPTKTGKGIKIPNT